jgi:hypothetical protein
MIITVMEEIVIEAAKIGRREVMVLLIAID